MRQRREVADERRHRHLVEQRVPDLGRRQVLRMYSLARQAVVANQRGRLAWVLGPLGANEALDETWQAVRLAAADDPLEQTSVLVRDVERRVARADAPRRVCETQEVAVRDARALAILDRLVGERLRLTRGVPA